MTRKEKLNDIKAAHPVEWALHRNRTFNDLSDRQECFCCCGKLATGLHELHCRKFYAKVNKEALRRWEEMERRSEDGLNYKNSKL